MSTANGQEACDVALRPIYGLALCAGAGGMELGLKLALGDAYRAVCYAERDTFAASVLAARMQDGLLDEAPVWDDLGTFDGRRWRGVVDIVTAGYPCPAMSSAGKRLGQRDPRWLWPEVARIVAECRPAYVFLENVGGHLRLAFDDVWADLGAMGYEREAGLFSAAEVGAPHERERLFVLAHAPGGSRSGEQRKREPGRTLVGAIAGPGSGTVAGRDSTGVRVTGDLDPAGETDIRSREELAHAERVRGERRGAGGEMGGSPGEPRGEGRERQRGGNAAHDSCPQLADPIDAGRSEQRGTVSGGECLTASQLAGSELADSASLRERESHKDSSAERAERTRQDAGWGSLGPFPPGPGDRAGWAYVLARVPAAQPAVCRLADESSSGVDAAGLAYRMDQLRCLGNGVLPMVAAHAFLILAERLGIAGELGVTL